MERIGIWLLKKVFKIFRISSTFVLMDRLTLLPITNRCEIQASLDKKVVLIIQFSFVHTWCWVRSLFRVRHSIRPLFWGGRASFNSRSPFLTPLTIRCLVLFIRDDLIPIFSYVVETEKKGLISNGIPQLQWLFCLVRACFKHLLYSNPIHPSIHLLTRVSNLFQNGRPPIYYL